MKPRKTMRAIGLALIAIALVVPATANATELWWFDHKQGRFPVATYKKVVEPNFSNLWLTNKAGKQIGPCKGVTLGGEIYNKFGGMGEGTLSKPEGSAEGCETTVENCIVHWLEPSPSPSWKLTLKTSKEVEITNLGITVEWTGECEKSGLPEEFSVSGTVVGKWNDFKEGKSANISFNKVEVKSGKTEFFLDGELIFGTEVTALKEPTGFTATTSPATIDGKQKGTFIFTRTSRSVECSKAEFSGSAKSGDTTLTITPTYSECTTTILGVKSPTTVKMNGCDYLLHLESEVIDIEKESYTYTAPTDLKCPEGKEVEIDVYTNHTNHTAGTAVCRYNLGETGNQGLELVDLTQGEVDEAKGKPKSWIEAHLEVGGISSKWTVGSVFFCGAQTDTAGTLKGTAELTGTDSEKEINGIAVFP